MNDRQEKVLNGFFNLTSAEQDDVQKIITRYASLVDRHALREATDLKEAHLTKAFAGPMTVGCPCCGS